MPVNIYDQPFQAQFMNTYAPMPYQEILQAGAAMQGRYDTAEAIRDDLTGKLLDVSNLKKDKDLKESLIGEYEESINTKLEEVGGDYGQLLPFIKQQQRKFQDDYKRGQLGQIHKNYNAYWESYQEDKKRMLKGEVNKEEFDANYQQALAEYTGVGDRGDLQDIQIRDLVNQHDYQEIAIDIASKLKASKTETLGAWVRGQGINENDLPNHMLQALDVTTEELKMEEIVAVVSFALKGNPMYQSHLNQRADLLTDQYGRKLESMDEDFSDAYTLTDDDKTAMEAQGLDPNARADKNTYVKDQYRQSIIDNLINKNAALAGEMFDVKNVGYTRNIRKDDLLYDRKKSQQDLADSTFISSTLGTLKVFDMDKFNESLSTATENAKEASTTVSTGISQLTGGQIPEGEEANFIQSYVTEMGIEGGREDMIEKIMAKNPEITPAQAADDADWMYEQGKNAMVSINSAKQQQSLIKSAREDATEDIDWDKEKDWFISKLEGRKFEDVPKEERGSPYAPSRKLVSGPSYSTGLLNETELDRLNTALFNNSAEGLRNFVKSFDSIEELQAAVVEEAGNSPNTLRKKQGTTQVSYEKGEDVRPHNLVGAAGLVLNKLSMIYNDLNEETEKTLKTGISRNYTKVDTAIPEGKSSAGARMAEVTNAKEALKDPSTQIIVNGQTTSLDQLFKTMNKNRSLHKVTDASLILDKGKPVYVVTAVADDGTIMEVLAEIPGRAHKVREFATANLNNKDSGVKRAAETYLGAEMMGEYWNPDDFHIMGDGQSQTIYLSDGIPIGTVTRIANAKQGDRGYKVQFEGESARYVKKPIDVAAEVYELVTSYQK